MTLPTPLEGPTPLRPLPWRRMAWVIWRQHRLALGAAATLLGTLALCLWALGLGLHHAYADVRACRPVSSLACTALARRFNGTSTFLWYGYVLQPVPALTGAFIGAPLLAREMETGTFRYAWAQGFGRSRWAVAKLVVLATVPAAAAGSFSLLVSWYYQPYFRSGNQAVGLPEWSPLAPGLFDLRGVDLAAWTLAAFSIGSLAGVLLGRVVPAIVATLAAYSGLALATARFLRQHYLAALVTTSPTTWVTPGSAWVMDARWATQGGRRATQAMLTHVLQGAPPQFAGKGGVPKAFSSARYLMQHGYTLWTTYQPGSRFWPFQWVEGGWLFALSVLFIATTAWAVRRRSA